MNTFTKISKYFLLTTLLFLGVVVAQAQDEEEEAPALSFSGTVDSYFRSTFNQGTLAPGTSFADGSGFSMGMVNLIASYEGEKMGFVGDLVFGPRGQEAAFGDTWTGQNIINQMYAYYNVNDKLTLTLGQWNTFLGYEVISPAGNVNYSCSYLFSWGPFNQAGLKADIALSDNWGLMVAFMNPTDVLESNISNLGSSKKRYTFGFQLSNTTDAGGTYLNFRYGDDQSVYSGTGSLWQVDLTGGYDLSDAFYLGFNLSTLQQGTNASGDPVGFTGIALYPKLTLSESFALGARAEYYSFHGGFTPAYGYSPKTWMAGGAYGLNSKGNGSVMEYTLSGNWSLGDNLTLIPEFRIDQASQNTFAESGATSPGSKTLSSYLLAAVYSF